MQVLKCSHFFENIDQPQIISLSLFCLLLWMRKVQTFFESFLDLYKVIAFSRLLLLVMSVCVLNILISGHSFVRRLRDDLAAFFCCAASNVHLSESEHVSLFDNIDRRTVGK